MMTNGDVVLLPPTAERLINKVVESILAGGQQVEVGEEVIAGWKLVKLTVVGKRAGEGQIAAAMKARR
jgi:hypothetical protein